MRLAALLAVLVGCSGKRFGPPLPPYHMGVRVELDAGKDPVLVSAHLSMVGSFYERALGPNLARGEHGALVAYVAGAVSGNASRAVVAMALDDHGEPTAQARVIAQAPVDTSHLVVRALDGGYVVAWTSLTDRGESLTLAGVGANGQPTAGPVEVARTPDDIVWLEVVRTPRGAVCLWAEEPPKGDASILAQALDPSGKPRGVPSRALRSASAWQATAAHDGVALGVVQHGELALARLDTEGRVVGEPLFVAKPVGADMDLVAAGGSLVFAWTDRARVDPTVVVAGVDAQNKAVAPRDVLPDAGATALVGLAAGDKGALVLWETAHKRERSVRRVNVATLADASSPLVTRTTLDLAGGFGVEARGRGDGWSLVGGARPCTVGAAGECGAPVPVFLRLDAALGVTETHAVLAPPISVAWGLDCGTERCLSLVAGTGDAGATTVYAMDLLDRPSTHASPVEPPIPDGAPRFVSTSTLVTASGIADVGSAQIGDTTLVATLVTTGTDDKTHEERVALQLTRIEAGKALATTTLSGRALVTGGVAVSASGHDAVVAYVAKDGGHGRVHVARVDAQGGKRAEVALPGAQGDASDVSVVAVADGEVVAWVDTRDGNGEVYVCKLTAGTPGPVLRITKAPGDATDTALALVGGNVVLVWADPRESPRDGFADIYAIALSSKDARPVGKEGRVLSTAAHSRSPVLARSAEGAALAWIEEAPVGAASEEAKGAMFAVLDERARPIHDPVKLRLHDPGTVTAVALDDDPSSRLIHAALARVAAHDEIWIDGARVSVDGTGAVESYPMTVLDGPSSMDVVMVLRGEELLFSDDADDARVKWSRLKWK